MNIFYVYYSLPWIQFLVLLRRIQSKTLVNSKPNIKSELNKNFQLKVLEILKVRVQWFFNARVQKFFSFLSNLFLFLFYFYFCFIFILDSSIFFWWTTLQAKHRWGIWPRALISVTTAAGHSVIRYMEQQRNVITRISKRLSQMDITASYSYKYRLLFIINTF